MRASEPISPSDAPMSGHRQGIASPRVTGSFLEAMMGGGAFVLLKTDGLPPQSAKQAEVRVARFRKVLPIGVNRARRPATDKDKRGSFCSEFCRVWLICQVTPLCYLDHSFYAEIDAVSCKGTKVDDDGNIRLRFYTFYYMKSLGHHHS